jgi:hypothetical protein
MRSNILALEEKQGQQVLKQEEEEDLEQEDQLWLQEESGRKQAQDQGQVCYARTGVPDVGIGGVIDYWRDQVLAITQVQMKEMLITLNEK